MRPNTCFHFADYWGKKFLSLENMPELTKLHYGKEEFFKERMLLEPLETNPLATPFTCHPMIHSFIFPDTPLYLKHRKFVPLVGKLRNNTYRSFTNLACFRWSIL